MACPFLFGVLKLILLPLSLRRKWLTCGHGGTADTVVGEGETAFLWEATAEQVKSTLQFWLPGEPDSSMDKSTAVIAYVFGGE